MVEELFRDHRPTVRSTVLDPGCGKGVFVEGILRWCLRNGSPIPEILGVELDEGRAAIARERFRAYSEITIRQADFLGERLSAFDFVIGNPPYVSIADLTEAEKAKYRERFLTAAGRFDLYLLFFERSLQVLAPGGHLLFITPEKFLYVSSAAPLRRLLAASRVNRLHLIDENTFEGLVTYPLISNISASSNASSTIVTFRDGTTRTVKLPTNGDSWLKAISARAEDAFGPTLKHIADRVSCGIATGADSIFVMRATDIPQSLEAFAYPTISGRQISEGGMTNAARDKMLVPYDADGSLIAEDKLKGLLAHLSRPGIKEHLLARTCAVRKPWYAFHESPVPSAICRPKILCKDIGPDPYFILDRDGSLLPRHSVYYIIPSDPNHLEPLFAYLNSDFAKQWLRDHCQRATKGFIRLQSHILKELPIPNELAVGSGDLFTQKKTA